MAPSGDLDARTGPAPAGHARTAIVDVGLAVRFAVAPLERLDAELILQVRFDDVGQRAVGECHADVVDEIRGAPPRHRDLFGLDGAGLFAHWALRVRSALVLAVLMLVFEASLVVALGAEIRAAARVRSRELVAHIAPDLGLIVTVESSAHGLASSHRTLHLLGV